MFVLNFFIGYRQGDSASSTSLYLKDMAYKRPEQFIPSSIKFVVSSNFCNKQKKKNILSIRYAMVMVLLSIIH